jgi:hypothetical protein
MVKVKHNQLKRSVPFQALLLEINASGYWLPERLNSLPQLPLHLPTQLSAA